MCDLLLMDKINALPQPLYARTGGLDWWPVCDIDVETGLTRIDVCGMLDVLKFGAVIGLRDANGIDHDPDSFYNWDAA